MSRRAARRLLEHRLPQPDARSCGAASLVMARVLVDDDYAELLLTGRHPVTGWLLAGTPEDRFRAEVLAMHRRVTGLADVGGRVQPPWPRWLGTPPWAVARQLSSSQTPYVVRRALRHRPGQLDVIAASVSAGRPVALFVGDRWLPRHVVLAVGPASDGLAVYDPARGTVGLLSTAAWATAELPFGRWRRPWLVVRPVDA